MNLDVYAVTQLTDPIELIDISYVYVNTLKTELRRANSNLTNINDFGIIYNDPEAVYFTTQSGEPCPKPAWINTVSFVDINLENPRLRIDINESENNMDGTYIMHVKYVDTEAGSYASYAEAEEANATILETLQPIRSSRRIVPGDEGDSILTVRIDTDNVEDRTSSTGSESSRWYVAGSGDEMEVRIPVIYLLQKLDDIEGAADDYEIFLVSAPTEAGEYFNYGYSVSRTYVSIKPQRNTPLNEYGDPEAITVNVSVSSTVGETRYILSLRVTVSGISETLTKERYTTIWLVAFFSSFGLLAIIFLVRMIIYWRRRAKQRQIIKRNQELIKLRDRMHNKSTSATREQVVKSKLKMQDPKYAKMVQDMRKERQGAESGGVVVENGGLGLGFTEPAPIATGGKGKKDKKGKPGKKKSIAELKAELEAKKMAFAQAQTMDPQAAPPPQFAADVGAVPVDGQPIDVGAVPFDGGFGAPDPFGTQDIDASGIIFDAPDNGQM